MKKIGLLVLLFIGVGHAYAQDEITFSDEELAKYAKVMAWAQQEKARMTETYNAWINNHESLEATRFLEIKNAGDDEAKLQELAATDEELAGYKQIQSQYDSMTSAFKEVYIGKIKEDIGVGLYNTLKKALKSDSELKARYEAIYNEFLQKLTEGATEETED